MFKNERYQFSFSFLGMLISFLVIMIGAPFTKGVYSSLLVTVFLGFILISSVFALCTNRTTLILGSLMSVCSVILIGYDFYSTSWWVHFYSQISAALLIGLTISVHFKKVFFSTEYSKNTIFGSICVFILLGFFFSLIYGTVEHVQPGSFKGFYTSTINSENGLNLSEMFQNFLYFSFVTQTTLGYGDIVPQTHLTQNIAITHAILGQFYLAVLVAGLIGKMLRNIEEEVV